MKTFILLTTNLLVIVTNTISQITVTYTLNTSKNLTAISPYIYGTNSNLLGTENIEAFRLGGNRLTGYNWENNYSNAGNDWNHSSDNYLVSSLTPEQQKIPGIIALNLVNGNASNYTLFTLPAAGYVSRDNKGAVNSAETAPSGRWRTVVNKKGSAFALTPDTSDNYIYVDEFINYLITKKGKANAGGIKAYLIDNEPDLWRATHPRLFNHVLNAAELVNKSITLAKTVKDMDNTADVFGYESYGFSGYYNLQNAPDWATEKGSHYWYIDYYLSKLKAASIADGRRLLDVLSLHWYPEAKGDHRIIDPTATSPNDHIARMQAPRTLWDSSYRENSWIAQSFLGDLPLIPRVQQSIKQNYEGTKLAFTEYNYGDINHVSAGIAQADILGIFGKYGVYAANYWNMQSSIDYVSAGFKIFRNFNGLNATFGNTSIYAAMSDKENSSIYASLNETNARVITMVVINKNNSAQINGQFAINSIWQYQQAEVWGFDAASPAITLRNPVANITNNTFTYVIPPLSVLLMRLQANVLHIADNNAKAPDYWLTPNPTTGYLKLEGIPNDANIKWNVYDIAGKELNMAQYGNNCSLTTEADFSTLPQGIYYIAINNGKNVTRLKFLKH